MRSYNEIELCELYKKYNRCRAVAEQVGCSDETVRRALIKHGIPRVEHKISKPVRNRKPDETEISNILVKYYDTDNTINDVSKIFHRSQATISVIIKSYGYGFKHCEKNALKVADEEILQDISLGLTRQEIADKRGIHVENLARRMKKLGVHAKYASRKKPLKVDAWHYTDGAKEFVEKHQADFEFVSMKRKRYKLRCKTCGYVIERANSTIRQKKCQCDKCQEQKQHEIDLQNERIKLVRSFYAILETKKDKTCAYCGKIFHSQYTEARYCSKSCKRRYRGTNFKDRCKKYNVFYDPFVTPIKVFERDHYQCKICGLLCNTDDNTWNGFIGAWHPTVDHIIPLSKGGTHTWDNVQCAHARCNSVKRDLITV